MTIDTIRVRIVADTREMRRALGRLIRRLKGSRSIYPFGRKTLYLPETRWKRLPRSVSVGASLMWHSWLVGLVIFSGLFGPKSFTVVVRLGPLDLKLVLDFSRRPYAD